VSNSLPPRIIDTHVHVWDWQAPWMAWLEDRPASWNVVRRNFSWQDLSYELDAAGIAELFLVQASPSCEESRMFLELADREASILGVVGWVSLRSGAATEADLKTLEGVGAGKLVGVRNNHGWLPDGDILATPAVIDSCRLLAERKLNLDLHFRDYRELPLALKLAAEVPELALIIDHLGKPLIKDADAFEPWAQTMAKLSEIPNLFLKYSGWATFLGRAQASDVRRYIEYALEKFGPDRMMFGSNWPVALVADSYEATFRATLDALPALSEADMNNILRETAVRCYLDRGATSRGGAVDDHSGEP